MYLQGLTLALFYRHITSIWRDSIFGDRLAAALNTRILAYSGRDPVMGHIALTGATLSGLSWEQTRKNNAFMNKHGDVVRCGNFLPNTE